MSKTVVIATNNLHKVEEIETALDFEGWEFRSLKDAGIQSAPEETGSLFIDNARIKAQAAFALAGCAVLADDSGLIVDALDGAPGVSLRATAAWMGTMPPITRSFFASCRMFRQMSARPALPASSSLSMRMARKRLLKDLSRARSDSS